MFDEGRGEGYGHALRRLEEVLLLGVVLEEGLEGRLGELGFRGGVGHGDLSQNCFFLNYFCDSWFFDDGDGSHDYVISCVSSLSYNLAVLRLCYESVW